MFLNVIAIKKSLCYTPKLCLILFVQLCVNKFQLPRKVEQVAEEADSLRKSLDRNMFRYQSRIQDAKDRKDLLERAVSHPPFLVIFFILFFWFLSPIL